MSNHDPRPRVLVAYGTRNGGTAGIANIIATELAESGVVAEVRPANWVNDVQQYDAVVLGGAVYAGRWHHDARVFARRYAKALQDRPVWVFSSGPLDNSADEKQIPPVAQAAQAVQTLHAREHVTFGGRLDEYAQGFIAHAMVRGGHGGDFRNDDRIRQWSRAIATELSSSAMHA
ncbi:MAG TPA: flavodoxin domain-containing protein [Micromonosporaceae bacterium]|jgi:menaquinone-dependent protoporphyrinogen oxidase